MRLGNEDGKDAIRSRDDVEMKGKSRVDETEGMQWRGDGEKGVEAGGQGAETDGAEGEGEGNVNFGQCTNPYRLAPSLQQQSGLVVGFWGIMHPLPRLEGVLKTAREDSGS